ncbi:substrate-binding domain-containing protein [Herbiconiux liukaitaii]|uniref:substrate-binding domain-containing protein n=1 Tax=Herbiconiux liukaitaii TaxID=3342799 RepID=UPI0035B74B84
MPIRPVSKGATRRRILGIAVTAAVAVGLTACSGGDGGGAGGGTVGILMPGVQSVRWQIEAEEMTKGFEERGYETAVQFANDDAPTQVEQMENMITQGVEALIVVAVDVQSLGGPLADAQASDIPILSYTRLLSDTEAVDYYTTFDYKAYGAASGKSILFALGVEDAEGNPTGEKGPFNIEIVNGSPTDSVAYDMWAGYEETLQPYVDEGVLQIPSGQTTFDQSSTLNWTGEGAQSRMENIVTSTYSGGTTLDAVWVPFDGMTRGVIAALKSSGIEPGTPEWPILPGGDGEVDSIKSILADEQYSSAWIDVITLSQGAVEIVSDVLDGGEWPEPDTQTDNGTKEVPTKLSPVVNVTKDNVQEVLVDSGFYTAQELGL